MAAITVTAIYRPSSTFCLAVRTRLGRLALEGLAAPASPCAPGVWSGLASRAPPFLFSFLSGLIRYRCPFSQSLASTVLWWTGRFRSAISCTLISQPISTASSRSR